MTYPAWVDKPEQDGQMGVVGWAPIQDMGGAEAQRRVALLKARKSLAETIQIRVEAETIQSITQSGTGTTTQAQSSARLRSQVALTLNKAYVAGEWIEPDTQNLYVWLRVAQ